MSCPYLYRYRRHFNHYPPSIVSNRSNAIMSGASSTGIDCRSETSDDVPEREWKSLPTHIDDTDENMDDKDELRPRPRRRCRSIGPQMMQMKSHTTYYAGDGVMDASTRRHAREHVGNKIYRGLPVHEFVRAVWDFGPEDIPDFEQYTLPIGHLNMYLQRHVGIEKNSSLPLAKILEHLLAQINSGERPQAQQRHITRVGQRLQPMFPFRLQERNAKGYYTETAKADLAWGTAKDNGRRHWQWYLSYVEVRQNKGEPIASETDLPISKTAIRELVSVASVSGGTTSDAASAMLVNTPICSGRKRKEPETGREAVDSPRKRARTTGPTDCSVLRNNEIQAANYMIELLSHGVRSYATGCTIKNTTMTLWYGDRMGIVQSQAFDFIQQPHLLLLYLAAMDSADHARMGLCPFLKFPTSAYDTYANVKLEIDDDVATDVDVKPLEKLVFEIDNNRSVYASYEAFGRGTTIVPIQATGVAKVMFGEDDLVAKMAWPSKEREAEDNFIKKIRRNLKVHAPRWLDHVVDLKCSVTRNMKEMNLPRVYMTKVLDYREQLFRMTVMKKYEALEQVNSVDEFKKVFVDVVNAHHWVWETAEALHRDISANNIMFYRKNGDIMGVLCDWDLAMTKLPEKDYAEDDRQSNIFNKPDENDIFGYPAVVDNSEVEGQSGQQVKVPAQDAPDIVEEEDEDGPAPSDNEVRATQEQSRKRPRYRTGTGPFMALDLLAKGDVPLHRYRHDLESFFFVLAWFCAVFDPDNHKSRHLSDWESPNLYAIGRNKRAFLSAEEDWRIVFASMHPDYAPLARTWVRSLRVKFFDLNALSRQIEDLAEDLDTAVKEGNQKEATSLDAQIARMKAQKDEMMTYEIFMQRLRIPTSSPR
ncbi:hypothetical protein AcW1_010344 [Taiwanofungus camphoratus]|nr:hypothetical protein AcV7_005125 [Antrodia cinnamomea]KAI0955486.1 hypothetical protein AcW1_010344 [Antrodia cinnamomea]